MKTDQKAPSKSLGYGAGALAVLVASLGVAAIAYSLSLLTFDLFNIPAWIFGPLGIYTLAAFYTAVSPFVILGILAIVIAIIGIVAYQRSKK
jgi:hypothetical protein